MAAQRISFVLFFPDGACGLIRSADGRLDLPTGSVGPDEDELDALLRIPLMTAGFRAQRFHPFRWSGSDLYAWVEGDRYDGRRPHRKVPLHVTSAEEATRCLRDQGRRHQASVVAAAARSYRGQTDAAFYADNVRVLEQAYVRAATVEGGSGFGGSAEDWRVAREPVLDGIDRDGTFLDIGCANGLLMESAQAWCAERGVAVEPYGVDLAPGLVELARARLPHWADRLWAGNALEWAHPRGMRFDFVHALFDSVPPHRYADLVRHLLAQVVAPDGRLLLSHYVPDGTRHRSAAEMVARIGQPIVGRSPPYTVWVGRP
ncbi:MAG: class I SAM-dependent methyltransferase [Acidimicrobiia bacterium]